MRNEFIRKATLVAAMLSVATAPLWAFPKAANTDLGSNSASSSSEITSLLAQMQSQAYRVSGEADQLQGLLQTGTLNDWEMDADVLSRVRAHVNTMDRILYRLRSDETEASPLQQKAIDKITPASLELSDTAQDAITTLRNNEDDPYMTNLPALDGDISQEANRVDRAVTSFDKHSGGYEQQEHLKTGGASS